MNLLQRLRSWFSCDCGSHDNSHDGNYWEDALRMRPDFIKGEERLDRYEHGCLLLSDTPDKDIDIREPTLVIRVTQEGETNLRVYRWVHGRVRALPAPMWHWALNMVVNVPEYRCYAYEDGSGTLMSSYVPLKLKATNGVLHYPSHLTDTPKKFTIIYQNRVVVLQYSIMHSIPGYRTLFLRPFAVRSIKACDYAGWDIY